MPDTRVRYYLLLHGGPPSPLLPPDIDAVPTIDRYRMQAVDNRARYEALLVQHKKCLKCCLLQTHCICQTLKQLSSQCGYGNNRIRFWIWMHYKERYRASNTGKLLMHFFPGSEIFTHGDPADAARLSDLIRESQCSTNTKVAVLYPSASSQSPASLVEDEVAITATNWDIIIVDGTWRQAKRMAHDIPLDANDAMLPHIKLAPKTLSQFSCRRQSREDRISTVEAAVLLLEELHVAELLRESVLRGLKELNLAFLMQGRGLNHVETKSTRFLNRLPKRAPTLDS